MSPIQRFVILLVGIISFASEAFAIRAVFSASFTQGLGGQTSRTTLNQQLPDGNGNEQFIIDNIGARSGGEFKATKNAVRNILTIANVNPVATKTDASTQVQSMRALVNSIIASNPANKEEADCGTAAVRRDEEDAEDADEIELDERSLASLGVDLGEDAAKLLKSKPKVPVAAAKAPAAATAEKAAAAKAPAAKAPAKGTASKAPAKACTKKTTRRRRRVARAVAPIESQ